LRLLPFGNSPIGSTLREARLPQAAEPGELLCLERQNLMLPRLAAIGQDEATAAKNAAIRGIFVRKTVLKNCVAKRSDCKLLSDQRQRRIGL
jgi:hypothetical protein